MLYFLTEQIIILNTFLSLLALAGHAKASYNPKMSSRLVIAIYTFWYEDLSKMTKLECQSFEGFNFRSFWTWATENTAFRFSDL